LREERRLKEFDSRVFKIIFWPKRDEVTREWRKLHTEELKDLCTPNIIWVIKTRRKRWVRHIAHMGKKNGLYRVLVGKRDRKRPHGRPRCK